MKTRLVILSQKEKEEIIDLFELSPLSVTKIAMEYGIARFTVYRIMHKVDLLKKEYKD